MTSEGLGELSEGNSAGSYARKCTLTLMGGREEGLLCSEPGAMTPIGVSGNFYCVVSQDIFVGFPSYHLYRLATV